MNIKSFMDQQIGALKEMQSDIVKNGSVLPEEDKKELEEYVDKQRRICENMKKVADVKPKEVKLKEDVKPKETKKEATPVKEENKVAKIQEIAEDDFDDILG